MGKLKLKKGDQVIILAGKDKNSTGEITRVITDKDKAIVAGMNMIKKHTKPSAANPQGGIVEAEAPIHISNLSLFIEKDGKKIPTRVGYKIEGDTKVRVAKKSGQTV